MMGTQTILSKQLCTHHSLAFIELEITSDMDCRKSNQISHKATNWQILMVRMELSLISNSPRVRSEEQ